MARSLPAVASTSRPTPVSHSLLANGVCPLCEQAIPHDRADAIAERLETREREQAAVISAELRGRFETEKGEALERARVEAAEKIIAAREEARLAAEVQLKLQIAQAELSLSAAQEALKSKTEEVEAVQATLQGQLEALKRDSEAALHNVKAQASANEAAIRTEAARVANEAAAAKIAEAEGRKAVAEQARELLQTTLEETQRSAEQALAQAKAEAATREAEVRTEVTAAVESAAKDRIAAAERAKAEAELKAAAAEDEVCTLHETNQAELAERLREQREALEAAKTEAVNAERSAAFEEKLKVSAKMEELQRTLDKKTAEELGEGAEIDLFEAIKAEFEGDRVARVNRGQPGADILHTIIHNGHECGTIIYDSKNHNGWRNEFVTKLRADQMAAKAEHAILSTRKFPSGGRQLLVQDGVLVASPARVVTLAQIVREHVIHTHMLRMSNEERARKTDALYHFITSQQCTDIFAKLDTQANALLEIQVKEMKSHEAVWRQQGTLIRATQKVQAELRSQIDSIISTDSSAEPTA